MPRSRSHARGRAAGGCGIRSTRSGAVTAVMTPDLRVPDREAVEAALIDHVAEGRVRRVQLGDDALWSAVPGA